MNDEVVLSAEPLHGESLERAAKLLSVGWAVLPGYGLVRIIPIKRFSEGFALMSRIAEEAETHNFNPELTLRHDEVEIVIPSYEFGGVTKKDIDFACVLDKIL